MFFFFFFIDRERDSSASILCPIAECPRHTPCVLIRARRSLAAMSFKSGNALDMAANLALSGLGQLAKGTMDLTNAAGGVLATGAMAAGKALLTGEAGFFDEQMTVRSCAAPAAGGACWMCARNHLTFSPARSLNPRSLFSASAALPSAPPFSSVPPTPVSTFRPLPPPSAIRSASHTRAGRQD